jgi:hypothetical protein
VSEDNEKSLLQKIGGEWRSWGGWLLTLIVIGISSLSCYYIISTYNDLHRPRLEFGRSNVQVIGNDLFLLQDVGNESDKEDAKDIRIKSEAIDLRTKHTEPGLDVTWPRLVRGHSDMVRIKLSSTEYPFLLLCVNYRSEGGKSFSDHAFLAVSGLQANMNSDNRWPSREDLDTLEANFPCSKLK